MIISVCPPSSVSFKNLKKQTLSFWNSESCTSRKKSELLVKSSECMILLKKQELLLSFNVTNDTAVSLLQQYLTTLFKDVLVVVDLENPVTQNLSFAVHLPRRPCHE